MPVYYDPYDVAIVADPYPTYAALRDEAPLYYNERYDFWALSRYADCARAMGAAGVEEGDQAAVARLLDELRRLNEELEVPTPRSYGIEKVRWDSLLPTMAQQALASGSPGNNPRVPTAEEIVGLYQQAWS